MGLKYNPFTGSFDFTGVAPSTLSNYVLKSGDTMTGSISSTDSTGLAYRQTRGGKNIAFGVSPSGNGWIYNYTDGVELLTIPAAGNGIYFGSGTSPRYITGTGFPNGVFSAPVGSIYIDTAITNGASSWIKKSGTGNTGWQVLEGASQNTFATNSGTAVLRVQRSGRTLFYSFEGTLGATVTNPILTIPDGYRPHATFSFLYGNGGAPYSKIATILTNGEVSLYSAPTASATIAGTGSTMASATYPTI